MWKVDDFFATINNNSNIQYCENKKQKEKILSDFYAEIQLSL